MTSPQHLYRARKAKQWDPKSRPCPHTIIRCWTHRMDGTFEARCRECGLARTVPLESPALNNVSYQPTHWEKLEFLKSPTTERPTHDDVHREIVKHVSPRAQLPEPDYDWRARL